MEWAGHKTSFVRDFQINRKQKIGKLVCRCFSIYSYVDYFFFNCFTCMQGINHAPHNPRRITQYLFKHSHTRLHWPKEYQRMPFMN